MRPLALLGIVILLMCAFAGGFTVGFKRGARTTDSSEREHWEAILSVSAASTPASGPTCTNAGCGFVALLKVWQQVDAAFLAYNRPLVSEPSRLPLWLLKFTERNRPFSSIDDRRQLLLPVFVSALVEGRLSFVDYLTLRAEIAETLKSMAPNPSLSRFLASVELQRKSFYERFGTNTPLPSRRFDLSDVTCRDVIYSHIKTNDYGAAFFDSWLGNFGPVYIHQLESER